MPQPSHQVEASGRAIAVLLTPPLLLALVGLALAWTAARFLPARPGPGIDFDQTLLAFKGAAAQRAATQSEPPPIILAGDSSCLMNVAVTQLDRAMATPNPSLNLATLSYLSLDDHRRLLLTAFANRITPPTRVVLLLHPQSLLTTSPSEPHQLLLQAALPPRIAGPADVASQATGAILNPAKALDLLRQRWLPFIAPVPLPGRYGAFYGYTSDLWNYLDTHRGSAIEPGQLDPSTLQGDPRPRLAAGFADQSRTFRTGWPAATRLVIGLSPVPRSLALPDQAQRHAAVLAEWNRLIGADAALTELPAVLDDRRFATRTHLTASAQLAYTRDLARSLASLPP